VKKYQILAGDFIFPAIHDTLGILKNFYIFPHFIPFIGRTLIGTGVGVLAHSFCFKSLGVLGDEIKYNLTQAKNARKSV